MNYRGGCYLLGVPPALRVQVCKKVSKKEETLKGQKSRSTFSSLSSDHETEPAPSSLARSAAAGPGARARLRGQPDFTSVT